MIAPLFKNRRSSPEFRELLGIINSRKPTGAIVLGSLGMGKTSLVEAVLVHTDSPVPVMRLFCTPSLAKVPYGVLSPYLGSLRIIKGPVEVLREMNKTLTSGASGNYAPVVVVEDAQNLDKESGFVLSLLVENAAMKLIAIGAGVLDGDSPLATLTSSAALSTIVVQPLDLNGAKVVAEEILDGRLSEGTARIIHASSGGNPSFVQAFVRSCLDQGILFQDRILAQENGGETSVWVLARPLPAVDHRLKDLVQEMQNLTSVEEQRTLEMLAMAGALPGKLLSRCGCPYRRLLDAGELKHSRDSVVSIASEFHEAILRQIVGPERNAELYAQWEQERRVLELDPTPLQVLWGVELGMPFEQDQILRAVEQATDALDFDLALRLCTSTQIAAHSPDGALLEARILVGMGRYYSSRGLLVRLIEQTTDQEYLLKAFNELMIVLSNLTVDTQDRGMIDQLWDRRVAEIGVTTDPSRLVEGQQVAEQLLEYWRLLNAPGAARPPVSDLEDLLADSRMTSEGRIIILSLLSDLHSIEGRCDTALDYARQALNDLRTNPRLEGAYRLKIDFRVGWNLLFAGRYGEAASFIESCEGSSIRLIVRRQGTLALLRGLADLMQGRARSAIGELAEAITELRLRDPAQLLSLALNLYEWALKRIGVNATSSISGDSRGLQGESGNIPHGSAEVLSGRRLFSRAVATASGNESRPDTIATFPLIEREVLLLESAQLDDETLAGHPAQKRLERLLPMQEGPRPRFIARLVALREQSDLDALEELGRDAVQHGEYQIGLEALTRTALRYAAAGEQRGCGAILRQVGRILDEENLTAGKFVARALALTELTAREKEIVDLAKSGINNAGIARTLTVSQRTVEGHLYRVFAKLGISERSELKHIGEPPGTG